jgi:hypothetical protein
MPETGSVHVVMGLLSSMVSFDSKIVTSCDELLVDITSRFFDSFRVLVRLTRVVLTLVCAYVEIWTDMALRIASDDLRWAEKKQNHGVMTTGRRADSERATAIKPNHDVCLHIASYFQEIGYVFCRAKLGMYRELLKGSQGILSHSRQWLVRLQGARNCGFTVVYIASSCVTDGLAAVCR